MKENNNKYYDVGAFCNGFARVRTKENKWLHICANGKPLYPNTYHEIKNFRNGYAAVRDNDGWFHINDKGKPAYQERYDYVREFYAERAVAYLDDRAFHIKPNGKPAYKQTFDWVECFLVEELLEGFRIRARVGNDGKIFLIDVDGNVLNTDTKQIQSKKKTITYAIRNFLNALSVLDSIIDQIEFGENEVEKDGSEYQLTSIGNFIKDLPDDIDKITEEILCKINRLETLLL